MLALAKNENKIAISCVLQGQVCNLLDFLCLSAFACIDVRTGVETHTHTQQTQLHTCLFLNICLLCYRPQITESVSMTFLTGRAQLHQSYGGAKQ